MFRKSSAVALALLALPMSAFAGEFDLKVEPGVSFPLSEPQTNEYGIGGSQQLKALFGINEYVSAGPTGSFLFLSSDDEQTESGVAWGFGGGVRVKLPASDAEHPHHGFRPWADADLLYVRTGELNRPGFDAAIGFAVPFGETKAYSVGPFVRYLHIFQTPTRKGYDNGDAQILTVGLSFEIGPGIEHKHDAPVAVAAATPAPVHVVVDQDGDGTLDADDACPIVAGPKNNFGCPVYKKLVVKKDKLELKERLYFAWNDSILQDVSFPVLDEVVLALKENKNFKVQVEGHTSSEGGDDHNQTLSEKRAAAVLDYLVSHGISKDRLVSKGFASSVPVDTNKTSEGRENNRRVEFVVSFIILKDGNK